VSEVTEARAEATAKVNASAEQSKTQTARIGELESELKVSNEAKTSALNKSTELEKTFKTDLSNLKNEKEAVIKERDEHANWRKKHKDWAEALKVEVTKLRSDFDNMSNNMSINQKLLAKAHIDLDCLRESYSEKSESESELVELVEELREKLTVASKYYYQLQQEHPELLSVASSGVSDKTSCNDGA